MERIAEFMDEIDYAMSNFDHSIDAGMADALKAQPGEVHGRHAAWNFNSLVYYLNGKFHAEVYQYRSFTDHIVADTLEELMQESNEKYGNE
jgi:hypothetical protein